MPKYVEFVQLTSGEIERNEIIDAEEFFYRVKSYNLDRSIFTASVFDVSGKLVHTYVKPTGKREYSVASMVGKKFNMLTVIKLNNIEGTGHRIYECICDCGATTYVRGTDLRSSTTKSCGCLKGPGRKYKTRTGKLYEIDGVSQTIKQWSKVYNVPIPTIYRRINSYKWDSKRAITTPVFTKLYKKTV